MTGPSERTRDTAALSRELSEFLIELSIAVHRYAMYPPGHPSLRPATENVMRGLGELLADRPSLSIGVARQQLVIEGVATDPRHPVLGDLARRLHEEHIGAVNFARGVRIEEVEGVLEMLARETDREVDPLGLRGREFLDRFNKVRLYPVGYDQLRLRSEEGETELERATQLWLALAQAAMSSDEPVKPSEAPDARVIAETIGQHRREAAYDQVIVGYMLQLAEELKKEGGVESERVRKQVSGLVRELDEDTLTRLVEMGGNRKQHRRFVLDSSQSLEVDSVMKILRSSATAQGQEISTSLTRLLTKLASHAERGTERVQILADSQLREHVDDLLEDWDLADPNPSDYTQILDQIAGSSPLFESRTPVGEWEGARDEEEDGARRLLRMSVEVGAWGPTVQRATEELVAKGEVDFLVGLVDDDPESPIAETIREELESPNQLMRLLSGEDVKASALRQVVERMGEQAIPPLLRSLSESGSRAVRRKVFDILAEMGRAVVPHALDQLEDSAWYVQRNMLALLQRIEELPEDLDPGPYLDHSDVRVRREALPLAIRTPRLRSRALATALGDRDERLVRMGLLSLRDGVPETLVPTVVNRVVRAEHSSEIRALAIRTLGGSRTPLALTTLLEIAVDGRSLLGRTRIAERSPEVIAAIEVLASTWSRSEKAREVLEAASRSKDPRIRAAAEGAGGGTGP